MTASLTPVRRSKRVVSIVDDATVTISDLTVDGAGNGAAVTPGNDFVGIGVHNANATIDNVTVTGVSDDPLNGIQRGRAIFVGNDTGDHTVEITDSTVEDYQKNAIDIRVSGGTLDADVTGNTLTGAGPTGAIAQNGVVFLGGVTGNIEGNTISGHEFTGPSNSANSAGVLLFSNGNAVVTVTGNTLTDNDLGIAALNSDMTIAGNAISNGVGDSDSTGIQVDGGTLTVGLGNTITGGTTGLRFDGTNPVGLTGDTLSNLAFSGQTGNYITLDDGAFDDQRIDASGVSFDGAIAPTDRATNFGIENKITHGPDDTSLGVVVVNDGELYVTTPAVSPGSDGRNDSECS